MSNDTRGAGTELVVPSDPRRLELDEGRSDFDIRHVMRGHFIWDLPFGRGRAFNPDAKGLWHALISGWQINGIVDTSSGFPLSIYSGFHTFSFYDSGTRVATTSANGVTNRANYNGEPGIGSVRRTDRGVEFFSADERALFSTPDAGETGSRRNLFTGPGYFQVDLGIFKNFAFGSHRLRVEDGNLQSARHGELRRSEHSGERRELRDDHRHTRAAADCPARDQVLFLRSGVL